MTSTPTNDDVFISLLALDAYMRGAARQAEHEGHGQCAPV